MLITLLHWIECNNSNPINTRHVRFNAITEHGRADSLVRGDCSITGGCDICLLPTAESEELCPMFSFLVSVHYANRPDSGISGVVGIHISPALQL